MVEKMSPTGRTVEGPNMQVIPIRTEEVRLIKEAFLKNTAKPTIFFDFDLLSS